MQERAARTRRTLVSAAACEFDRSGYAGASLVRIARSAGISLGALTFHFSNKEELAEVVRAKGHDATVAVVDQVRDRQEPPVESVVTLTLALAGLLEADHCVRAAARLTRELPGCAPDWTSAWVPLIGECLGRGGPGRSGPVADPAALTVLATHLVAGAEADLRRRADHEEDPAGRTAAQLARIWDLVLGDFRSWGAG
ncbi:TetR/AcrR family transcriptional regulator [Streptomyces sp. NBC_00503]|uniref:TetR/AcrR family transcriptional regulator n=1 Tax=Streptomyces sp. NBC_00503 TaxID=2903659 RepID=UPI002E81D81F|nr:TetR/AcrR family transcriptional regulator [Streptomyces sp. NBC_00503]WUD86456.1 TetR/AcrR family transcriptional regulator [Streptomyces sp. NBC_00503]